MLRFSHLLPLLIFLFWTKGKILHNLEFLERTDRSVPLNAQEILLTGTWCELLNSTSTFKLFHV